MQHSLIRDLLSLLLLLTIKNLLSAIRKIKQLLDKSLKNAMSNLLTK